MCIELAIIMILAERSCCDTIIWALLLLCAAPPCQEVLCYALMAAELQH